jgi:hypothetical protein
MGLQVANHEALPSRVQLETQISAFRGISYNFRGNMAFATRAQLYEISNGFDRVYRILKRVESDVRNACASEGFPTDEMLEGTIRRANSDALKAYENMLHWNDLTAITHELFLNASTPDGGELPRRAKTNVPERLYNGYRELLTQYEDIAREAVADANRQFRDLRAAPAWQHGIPRNHAGGPMGGSGKPGENAASATKEQGYEISNGLLRLYERLKDLAAQAKDARDADNLPLSDELVRLSLRAENLARRVEHDKIMYDGITGIDDGAFRANFSLAQNEGWRKGMQEMESDAADIESRIKKEIEVERDRRSVVEEELRLLGSGKPGKSRGDEWHRGQNRRYV